MISFLRIVIHSRIGALIALVFIGLIALAFAGADVTGSRIGNIVNRDSAATIGAQHVSATELGKTVTRAFEGERQQNPQLTLKDYVAQGALDEALTGMIDRAAMMEWAKKYGMGASDRLVDSEIVKIAAFQGPDGKFSDAAYKQFLAQRGFTDAFVREDLGKGLIARQLLVPASFGAMLPRDVATRYAALLKERRQGTIAFIPSLAFAPKQAPSDQDLAGFWQANAARYTRPETRTIRFAMLDETAVKNLAAPSDAEIQQRYKLNAATYAAAELRTLTQVIVPTEAAAKALAAEVAAGKTIDAAAQAKGLSASKLADQTRDSIVNQASQAVADAAFAAAQGKLATPAKSGLGWHVIRIDAITRKPGKTVDQARAEIVTALTAEKRRAALTDLTAKIEEQFEKGTGLADAAKSLGVTLVTSDPVQADGNVAGKPGVKAPAEIAPLLQTAYSMEHEGEPQVTEVPGTGKFAMFEVAQITAAAPAPLAQIKDQVARDYATDKGFGAAKAAADKVMAALAKGTSLADALKALGVTIPPVEPIDMNREQLAAIQQQRNGTPPALGLLFSMAQHTNKRLEVAGKGGWMVVQLASIIPGEVKAEDPLVTETAQQLGQAVGQEYAQQLRAAMRNEVGVKRNERAIAAIRTQLAGGQ